MPVRDALDGAQGSLDIEGAGGADGDAALVRAGLPSGRDGRNYDVSGAEAEMPLCRREVSPRESLCREAGSLARTPARAFDCERLCPCSSEDIDIANAGSVERMGFRKPEAASIPLCAAAATSLDRQSARTQSRKHREAGGVDCGCAGERSLCPCQDLSRPIRIVREKLFKRPAAFGLVAGWAGEREVADAVGAASRLRNDVLDLERRVFGITVHTVPAPLFEEVLPHLVAGELALLVLNAADLRVLHELRIEPHEFNRDSRDRRKAPESDAPTRARFDSMA